MGRIRMRFWGRVSAVLMAIAVAVLLPFGGRGGARASPEDSGPIVGQVIDEATKKPIAGALVSLWQRDDEMDAPPSGGSELGIDWPTKPLRTVRADANGGFTFPATTGPRMSWLTVSATGYAAAVPRISKGVLTSVALVATPLTKFRFVRAANGSTAPAAGASVVLYPGEISRPPSQRFTADADGRVAMPVTRSTNALVLAPGCAPLWLVALGDGMPAEILLDAGAPIDGVVRTPTGEPVVGATVRLWWIGMFLRTQTDASGRFRFKSVPTREAHISLEVLALGSPPRSMNVAAGDRDVQVVVGSEAHVSGRVVDEAGKPVADAEVRVLGLPLEAAELPDVQRVRSSDDGSFRLDSVPPGFCVVAAYRPYGVAGMRLVHVLPGRAVEGLEIRPRRRSVRLAIRVVDERRGLPVPLVRVRALDEPGMATDSEGRATVEVVRDADGGAHLYLGGGPLGAGSLGVTLSRADVLRGAANVAIASSAPLRLTVFGPDGKPLDRAHWTCDVALDAADVALAFDSTVQFGRSKDAPTVPAVHPFRLRVVAPALGAEWQGVLRYSDAKDGALEVRLHAPPVVRGRCATRPGVSSTSLFVAAHPMFTDERIPGVGSVVAQVTAGRFELNLPTSGKWRLVFLTREETRLCSICVREIDVSATGPTDLGDFGELQPTTLLTGVVRAAGRPVAGAVVAAEFGVTASSATLTESDGTWEMTVPRGAKGTVAVTRKGLGTVGVPFGPDATAPIDLAMPVGCAIILRNAVDSVNRAADVEIRSAGSVRKLQAHRGCGELEVEALAPGPVEIVVGDDLTGRRTVRAEAVPGRVVEVDLATAK